MAIMNFSEMLMEAKRKAQLQGRPVSEQEVRGITEGYAKSATDTGLRERGLEIQEKGLGQQESQFTRQLAQRKAEVDEEMRVADEERKHQKMRGIASGVGTVAGGILGGFLGAAGTYGFGTAAGAAGGAALGGSVGSAMYEIDPLKGVAKGIFGGCIIISSCTSPTSYEVELAREYRDKHMDEDTLFGYYFLCGLTVPGIKRFSSIRWAFKRLLVDSLVDYGEWMLGRKHGCRAASRVISQGFLGACRFLGIAGARALEVIHG